LAPEERSVERRALLVEAAFDLLGTQGWYGTTVRAVCRRARLNPRYFYESFEDLDQLVVAVYDRVVEALGAELRAVMDAHADDPDPQGQLRACVEALVGFVDDDRRRARVLYVEALGNEALNRRRVEAGHAAVGFLLAEASARHGPPPEGEHLDAVAASLVVGGLSELLVDWLDGRVPLTREQLVTDATLLLAAVGEAAAAERLRRARQRG
jgi:AcrR family transcriptional regulator